MEYVDYEDDSLFVTVFIFDVCTNNQLVAGCILSNFFLDIWWQLVKIVKFFQRFETKCLRKILLSFKTFKNWFWENLTVDQIFQPYLERPTTCVFHKDAFVVDSVGENLFQKSLLTARSPEWRCCQSNDFQFFYFFLYMVDNLAVGFCDGVVRLIDDKE